MNSKTSISLSSVAIAVVVLLFATGPIVQNQQAFAANLYGSGLVRYHGGYGYHGYYHGHYRYYHGYYHGHYRYYHGHGVYHKGVTVKTPRGIYHKGVTVRAY
jgi:hypothetical protein